VTNSESENEEFRKIIFVPVFNIIIFLYVLYRYLFWTAADTYYSVRRMNFATNNIRTLARQSWLNGITLDYTNKRVYWIERNRHIFSSDYDFQHLKSIRNGSFRSYPLAISGDSLYFQNADVFSINQVNISNGNIVRSFLVDKGYRDLIVLHSSLQSMGM
jgi:hypothetical protein